MAIIIIFPHMQTHPLTRDKRVDDKELTKQSNKKDKTGDTLTH